MRLIDADELKPDLLIDGKPTYGIVLSLETIEFIIDEQPTVNEWVSVSERLPEEEKQYLCVKEAYGGLHYKICRYAKDLYKLDKYHFIHKKGVGGFYVYDTEYGYLSANDIIAWMPIPEYGGDSDGNNKTM